MYKMLTMGAVLMLASLACAEKETAAAPAAPAAEVAAEATAEADTASSVATHYERTPAPVMSHLGAAWLERPTRDEEERPEIVLEAMKLKNGDVVADIGVGSGYYARKIAPLVAPDGKVLGVDIQPEMLDILTGLAIKEEIANIEPILGTIDDPNLPDGALDWILLVDTYHEFAEPQAMLKKIKKALKPDGKVCLVEYRLLGTTAAHIKKEHRMSVEQVLTEWEPAGFVLEELIEEMPSQHLFIFRMAGADED